MKVRFVQNRSSMIIKPKQPVVDWLNSVYTTLGVANFNAFDPLSDHGDTFLVPTDPEIRTRRELVRWLEAEWQIYFEFELKQWILNDAFWPKNRTLALFRQWFDIEYHSMVWDLGNEPTSIEDWIEL